MLDRGGYVRYDFKTADKLLEVSRALLERYGGNLNQLHEGAEDPRALEGRLKALGRGVGDATVGIFLRELRGLWEKTHPGISAPALEAARELGFLPEGADGRQALTALQEKWSGEGRSLQDFPDFEAALVRRGLRLRRARKRRIRPAAPS